MDTSMLLCVTVNVSTKAFVMRFGVPIAVYLNTWVGRNIHSETYCNIAVCPTFKPTMRMLET